MGYTHYWSFDFNVGKRADLEAKYQKAILECQRVVRAIAKDNRNMYHSSCLSGYTAHSRVGKYAGLSINGKGEEACEYFTMREYFKENEGRGFCKTGRYTYDFAVVACLAILKYRLGNAISITSDGTTDDWQQAVDYAAKILRRKVKVPNTIAEPKNYLKLAR